MKEKKSFQPVRYFRISDENYDRMIRLKVGTWNHTFNKLTKRAMGLLDYKPIKMFTPSKELRDTARDTVIKCDKCKTEFMGFEWMKRSKRLVLCPDCYKNDRQDL